VELEEIKGGDRGRGGLFRSLLLPMLGLVVVVGLLGTVWSGVVRESDEGRKLQEILEGNARMVERMNLPLSEQMVSNLSTVMGRPVGLVSDGAVVAGGDAWSERELELVRGAADSENGFVADFGYEGISVEVGGGEHLVVVRELGFFNDRRVWGFLWVVVPIGAVVAYWLARRLAKPLEDLAVVAPEFGELALPRRFTERSDEVGILARALDGARDRISREQEMRERSERLAMLGQIATGLAHEIKNPASAILMQAVRDEAEDIVGLVNQWLFIAQPSSPKMGVNDLVVELRRMVERREEVFLYHSVHIRLDVPEELDVVCDARRVMQAVRNVVDNGVAAMPEGGELVVSLEESSTEICLSVRDGGEGFSEEALARVGEPFFSEKEGGMGLGLAMVKGVMEGHEGRFEVSNMDVSSGGGVVKMWFPIKKI